MKVVGKLITEETGEGVSRSRSDAATVVMSQGAAENQGAAANDAMILASATLQDGEGSGKPTEYPRASDAIRELDEHAYQAIKRAFDVVSASVGLVAFSPLMLAAAIAVKATSRGPILFRQIRFGKDRRPFVCYKFRSMTVDTPDNIPTSEMNENPDVMTPIGAFLRKTSIDELPQLINIIRGDMSVIGPRPMILKEIEQIEERERYQANDIRPGLTGWAQINGRDNVSVEDKARLDGDYRHHMGIEMDAACFIKSVEVVLKREGYKGEEESGDAPTQPPVLDNAVSDAASKMSLDSSPVVSSNPPVQKPLVQDGAKARTSDPETEQKKLKVLVVSQHYWPEPFNFADICESLAERGHDVTVLTGIPNYPEGKVYAEYNQGRRRYEVRNGVRIIRSSLIPRGTDAIHRVLNYFSFSARARHLARGLERDFDVVLAFQTSPVMMAEPALEYGRRAGVPVLLWCVDIWPECLTAGGIKRGTPPYEAFRQISKSIYSRATRLAVTSPLFEDYMRDTLGITRPDVLYLPQYAEDAFGKVVEPRAEGFDKDRINLTFAGNVGSAQSVETIIEAANLLKDDDRFLFHIVGSGSSEPHCKQLTEDYGLNNVVFHGRHSIGSMPAFYAASDAMVATFASNPVLGYTLPRKVQSYLASGKPVLGTLVGEARRVIDEANCGLCCDPDDYVGLAAACVVFAEQGTEVREGLGRNAKAYYEAHYTKANYMNRLEGALWKLKEAKHD